MNPSLENHPSPESWADFLYRELPSAEQARLEAHLAECAECRAICERWRATLSVLDTWQLPQHRPASMTWSQPVRWAAAAAIVLACGLVLGRWTAPQPDLAAFKREITQSLRAQMRHEFQVDLTNAVQAVNDRTDHRLTDLAQAWAAARQDDQQAIAAGYDRLDQQEQADVAWLRRDLETVAVNAQAQLSTTRRGLDELYAYSESKSNPLHPTTPVKQTNQERIPK